MNMIIKDIIKHLYINFVIDLDLPSGNLWSRYNLGATSAFDSGDCFAWGETERAEESMRYKYRSWEAYKWSEHRFEINKYTKEDKYKQSRIFPSWYDAKNNFTGDGKCKLDLEDDASNVLLGGDYCIPRIKDFSELLKYCNWEETKIEDILKVTSKKNSEKFIYLPMAPYWTSELSGNDSSKAVCLNFYGKITDDDKPIPLLDIADRTRTCNIRPIIHKI